MTVIALMVASFFCTVSEFKELREEINKEFEEIRTDIALIKEKLEI